MATEADIEELIDSCTEATCLVVYDGKGDTEQIRTHVRATLTYLAVASDTVGCYDTLDDLIHYVTNPPPADFWAELEALTTDRWTPSHP